MGLPRHIICVDAGTYARARGVDTAGAHDLADAVAFLLEDFAEALNVYARLSAAGKGGADTSIPEVRQHVVAPTESHADMAGFDTVVIGYAARTRRGSAPPPARPGRAPEAAPRIRRAPAIPQAASARPAAHGGSSGAAHLPSSMPTCSPASP